MATVFETIQEPRRRPRYSPSVDAAGRMVVFYSNRAGGDNDLFVATHVSLDADRDAAVMEPARLTPDESFTSQIAVAQRDGELIVLRAGRARVRKSPADAGAPPLILQSRIACD